MMHFTKPSFPHRAALRKMLKERRIVVLARPGFARKGKYTDPVCGTCCIAGDDGTPINVEIRDGYITRIVGTS